MKGGVDLVLGNLPTSIRRGKHLVSSDHDSFSLAEMTGLMKFLKEVLGPGDHGHIFCPALPLGVWYQKLTKSWKRLKLWMMKAKKT